MVTTVLAGHHDAKGYTPLNGTVCMGIVKGSEPDEREWHASAAEDMAWAAAVSGAAGAADSSVFGRHTRVTRPWHCSSATVCANSVR